MGSRPSTRKDSPSRAQGARRQATARRAFLKCLSEGWSVTKAAQVAGVDRKTVYNWRGKDEEFARAWEVAIEDGTDCLEDAARRRAVEGIETTRYSKNGEEYTTITYSDRLLELLLKSRRPEQYRERYDVQSTGETKIVVDLRPAREPEGGESQE